MRKRMVLFLAEGFEEIEAFTVVDILRRAGIEVVTAGISPNPIKGSRGVSVLADKGAHDLSPDDFDMVVIPGGLPGVTNLSDDASVIGFVREMNNKGKFIAAICAATRLLKKAGLTQGKTITSHPSISGEFPEATYTEDRVVRDGRFITSRGPGTAMEFAFRLVEIVAGEKAVEEVNKGVLARL